MVFLCERRSNGLGCCSLRFLFRCSCDPLAGLVVRRGSSGVVVTPERRSPVSIPVAAVILSNSFNAVVVLITAGGLPGLEQIVRLRELLHGNSD